MEPVTPKNSSGSSNGDVLRPTRKRALVTGASRGIGRVTVLELAQQGYDLTLVVRDRARGEGVVQELRAQPGAGNIELLVGDLSSMKDVARTADAFLATHDRLDVLINNAGAVFPKRQTTTDGFERTFATNHLAYFLFTNLLRGALEKAAPSRVVVVASEAHRRATINWDDFMHERRYAGLGVYGESKLANILFARELAKRLAGSGVTANSLHPGFVASNFGRENSGALGLIMPVLHLLAISEEKGAKTSVYLATSPDVARVTGKYFNKCREATPSRAALDDEDAAHLWQLSEELLEKIGIRVGH
jgi:NAD(P)-dependent dehydrogenase (short-subunit alcohol dehydrogenase family)